MAQLKMDDAGHVVVQDGKPVYTIDGKDVVFDYASTLATIARINGEAKGHREAKEEALGRLKQFEGIEDPASARKALETVANIDTSKLIHAGKIDEVKAEAQRAFDDKLKAIEASYKPVVEARDKLQADLHREVIGGNFARSKFIADKLAVPLPMVEATFGQHFALDGGKLIAKDVSGNQIYSRARPGEIATFDEALEMLVDSSPYRDSILKGTGASGSGAQGSQGGNGSGKRNMSRAQFDGLAPAEKAKAAREVQLVD